jgi:DNA uptake protein ComE-like DNA-binding protein
MRISLATRFPRIALRAALWSACLLGGATGGFAQEGADPPDAAAVRRIDLNRASLREIETLPIPSEVARAIWEQREFVQHFRGAVDLNEIDGLTPEMLQSIKPLIVIEPVKRHPEAQRKDDLFYRFEWWEGAEGRDESIVELYKVLALEPTNINEASYMDVYNLQNASPVDAAAIINYRKQVGEIGNRGQLRRATGLTGWGYSNIRNFVIFEPPEEDNRLHGGYSLRVESTTDFPDLVDLFRQDRDPGEGTNDNWWDRLRLDNPNPAVYQKLLLRYKRRLRGGLVTGRRIAEEDFFDTKKGFVSYQDVDLGRLKVEKILLGNYQVSWGQGVVMENTDFFSPRKAGYNFTKRYDGVIGDLSRTHMAALRGVATEVTLGPVRALGIYSDDDKDAILNADGSVNMLVRLTPRVEDDELKAAGLRPMRDQVNEKLFGGNLRYNFQPGSWLGFGGYEARYDRFFDPKWDPTNPSDKHPLIADDDEDNIVAQDAEMFSSLKSDGKFRRVYGADFQWVYRNMVVQGEYAELDKGGKFYKIGDDPRAMVFNAYVQEENLNVLLVYRDYDVAFDNPYQRSFSNYKRFKGTVLEDEFRLQDPIYGLVYDNAAQPQAERGFYINTRYRFADPFIATVEWDTWRRQADKSKYSRFVGRLEYRVLFPLRFKLRQKWQNREHENLEDPTIFHQSETIWAMEYRLSRFDELEFRYGSAYIKWPPRGRLQGEPEPNGRNPISGNNSQDSKWWSAKLTHHLKNRRVKIDGEVILYEGFWWFFEKNTFRVIDGNNGFRTWVEVTDRVSDGLTARLRYVRDNQQRLTNVDIREFNEEVGDPIDADDVRNIIHYFRVQLDYTF